jgi:hypothetical protein
MPFGHYVSISATGPGAKLWLSVDGTWTPTEADRRITLQVHLADHQLLAGLPAGYHTRVEFESVT